MIIFFNQGTMHFICLFLSKTRKNDIGLPHFDHVQPMYMFGFSQRIFWVVFFVCVCNPSSTHSQLPLGVEGSAMSGVLQRRKKSKRKWKRLWFLLKDKVLYTFTAREVRGRRVLPQQPSSPSSVSCLQSRRRSERQTTLWTAAPLPNLPYCACPFTELVCCQLPVVADLHQQRAPTYREQPSNPRSH